MWRSDFLGWSVGRLVSRSVGRSVGWMVGRSIGRLVIWWVCRSVGPRIYPSVRQSVKKCLTKNDKNASFLSFFFFFFRTEGRTWENASDEKKTVIKVAISDRDKSKRKCATPSASVETENCPIKVKRSRTERKSYGTHGWPVPMFHLMVSFRPFSSAYVASSFSLSTSPLILFPLNLPLPPFISRQDAKKTCLYH